MLHSIENMIKDAQNEGRRLMHEEDLIRQEHQRVQVAKAKVYNKEHLSTTNDKMVLRVVKSDSGLRGWAKWWYYPLVGRYYSDTTSSFVGSTDFLYNIKGYDELTGMFELHLSFAELKGYSPIQFKYVEKFYDSGKHMCWDLCYSVGEREFWNYVPQGFRSFVPEELRAYRPKKYLNESVFTLWVKLKNIQPTRY